MKQITIDNLPITLERKRIKNMYLRILPPDGRVSISAPLKMSEEEIKRFVLSKKAWIKQQQEKLEHRHTHQEQMYETGEEIYIWGRRYSLIIKETSGRSKLEVIEDEVILTTKPESTREQKAKLMNSWYKRALEQEIPFLLTRWEKNIGVKASTWSIRDMKTRWGTCHVQKKAICLNLQLAKKPPECLEYVVVHELVHLLEKSHNQVFKSYMDRYLPNWRKRKKELNGEV